MYTSRARCLRTARLRISNLDSHEGALSSAVTSHGPRPAVTVPGLGHESPRLRRAAQGLSLGEYLDFLYEAEFGLDRSLGES